MTTMLRFVPTLHSVNRVVVCIDQSDSLVSDLAFESVTILLRP